MRTEPPGVSDDADPSKGFFMLTEGSEASAVFDASTVTAGAVPTPVGPTPPVWVIAGVRVRVDPPPASLEDVARPPENVVESSAMELEPREEQRARPALSREQVSPEGQQKFSPGQGSSP